MSPLNLSLDDLPDELQAALMSELTASKSKKKSDQPGIKEAKVKATAGILTILSAFTIPTQRTILTFTQEVLEKANKRWSNDPARHPSKTKK